MMPNKNQMYLLIVALDLAGVGPTKGVKPDFASMLDTTIQNEIVSPVNEILSFGSNGPAGSFPAYPEKATTWKTLLKHGKNKLAGYNYYPNENIDADIYTRIGAEFNMMQNTRKSPNGYTDGGGFKHSTSKGAIQKGIKDHSSHLHNLLKIILNDSAHDGMQYIGNIAQRIGAGKPPTKVDKPAKEVAPVVNEALMARSLPSTQPTDVLLPKKTYGTDMPIPPNYKTAVRKLKQKDWTNDKAYRISSYGASVFIHLFGEPEADKFYQLPDNSQDPYSSIRTPDIIVKFTVGKKPIFSTFVGNTATTYPFSDENVTDIQIAWSNPADGPVYATECNIIHGNNEGLIFMKGMDITGIKVMEKLEFPQENGDLVIMPECLEFGLLPDGEGVKGSGLNEEDENFMENLKKLNEDGCGVYYFKPQAKLYASPDMYIPDKAKEEEYLLPPEVDFKSITPIGNDEYITFDLKIENPTFSTDNYTGRDSFNPRSSLVERLMFPGDEGLLAPLGITANGDEAECGKESPEGRVLKSIKVAKTGGAIFKIEMEFRDGSSCIFPDPESKVFSAVDKETGQLLKGKVEMQSINLDTGDIKDNYSNLVATRRGRNLNREHNIMAGDDNLTAAIAWRGGKQGETLKIIVPDPDNEGKSVIITIPLMEV